MINRYTRLLALLSLAAVANVGLAAPAPMKRTHYQAIETSAGAVTLPGSREGSLAVIPCPGCAPKSFRAVAKSQYLLNEQAVTLAELRAAILGKPKIYVTVIFDEKTNELFSISASVDAALVPNPAKAGRNRQPAR